MKKYFIRYLLVFTFLISGLFFLNNQIIYAVGPTILVGFPDSEGGPREMTIAAIRQMEFNNYAYGQRQSTINNVRTSILESSAYWQFYNVYVPFTFDRPLTKDFFSKVDAITGDEEQIISSVYALTTAAVPKFGELKLVNTINGEQRSATFEETLSSKKGVCRDQAPLLNEALKRKGIKSSVVRSKPVDLTGHMWVRVESSTGELFDLDPTWYKDFIKLVPRINETCPTPTDLKLTKGACPARDSYSVIFVDNDSDSMAIQIINRNKAVALRGNTFTKDGYEFVGWSTTEDGLSANYRDKQIFSLPEIPYSVALYAVWVKKATITFNPNWTDPSKPGTGTTSPQEIVPGTRQSLNLNAFQQEGYTFDGWATAPNTRRITYRDRGNLDPRTTTSLNLYAVWTPAPYRMITFDANYGLGSIPAMKMYVNKQGSLPLNSGQITKVGYKFDGWTTNADGTGTYYKDGGLFSLRVLNVTLYAKWVASYTLTFNSNGGTGSAYVQTLPKGISTTLVANTFTRDNYRFVGWATSATGPVLYSDKAAYLGSANATLYAVWVPVGSILISFDANGGGGYMPSVIATIDKVTTNINYPMEFTPPTLRQNWGCWIRSGWSRVRDGARIYSIKEIAGVTSVTLYARWAASCIAGPTSLVPDNHNYATASVSWESFLRLLQALR